jgi:hypothetical protein
MAKRCAFLKQSSGVTGWVEAVGRMISGAPSLYSLAAFLFGVTVDMVVIV